MDSDTNVVGEGVLDHYWRLDVNIPPLPKLCPLSYYERELPAMIQVSRLLRRQFINQCRNLQASRPLQVLSRYCVYLIAGLAHGESFGAVFERYWEGSASD